MAGIIFVIWSCMRLLFITLCFMTILPFSTYAQEDELDHVAINSERVRRPVVKAGIAHVINFSEALLPVALEYRFGRVISGEVELGIPLFFNTLIYRTSSAPVKTLQADLKYRANVRFYFPSETDHAAYIGLDGSMRHQKFKLENAEYYDESAYRHTFTSVDVRKMVYTANIIVGMQANVSKRMFVEIQAGLGYKGVEVERSNIVGDERGQYPFTFRWEIPIGKAEDKIASQAGFFNIPFALRLCYRL